MTTFKKMPNGAEISIEGKGNYLWLPVCEAGQKEELTCAKEGQTLWRLTVPDLENADNIRYYGAIAVEDGTITLTGNFTETFFAAVKVSDRKPDAADLHPALHFAAQNGWINDPNGLIYSGGVYHMYFQFNPVDMVWGNLSWGHAVSRDLLHWRQTDDVMYPDEDGMIFSGSALPNDNGCLSLPENALLFYYTSAGNTSPWSDGRPFTQKAAYSLDGGNVFVKIKKPVVGHIAGENRDPKIYWYAPRGLYYMVLYLENDEFVILNSTDLQHFTVTQHFYMEGSGECPDLRCISADDGSRHWMFMQADGRYYLGDFDGSRFEIQSELQCAYRTTLPYAAQTMNQPEDRVILIPWLRTRNPLCAYTGMMGLPRELSLVRQNNHYRLRLRPVKEYFEARRIADRPYYAFDGGHAMEIGLSGDGAAAMEVGIGNLTAAYDPDSGILRIDGQEFPFEKGLKGLNILVDKGILEISSPDDLNLAAVEVPEVREQGEISVKSGATAVIYEI